MRFDWNPDKAKENERKHEGVTFEEAVEVFYDENAVEDFDDEHAEAQEIRYFRVGNSSKRLLRVSFTVRANETEDEIIRIISARKGQTKEEEIYYEQNR
ncbi:MAG: BrnT family toxin [Pyrinomonadaceae bacterium]|nr:BrnT family toxin [Pyrinomonadaceae bacterium]